MGTPRATVTLTALALSALAVLTPSPANAVVGGKPIDITQAPWQVRIESGNLTCGGTIIDPEWVITAAHCVNASTPETLNVFAGITNITQIDFKHEYPVEEITIHPRFNARTYTNDVAMVKLARPIAITARSAPATLPTAANPNKWPAKGTKANIAGWGDTETGQPSPQLRRTRVQVLASPSVQACGDYGQLFDPRTQLCAGTIAGTHDACQGDSGGGLITRTNKAPILTGIASTGNGCGQRNYPGIYTRITSVLPWITQNLKS